MESAILTKNLAEELETASLKFMLKRLGWGVLSSPYLPLDIHRHARKAEPRLTTGWASSWDAQSLRGAGGAE